MSRLPVTQSKANSESQPPRAATSRPCPSKRPFNQRMTAFMGLLAVATSAEHVPLQREFSQTAFEQLTDGHNDDLIEALPPYMMRSLLLNLASRGPDVGPSESPLDASKKKLDRGKNRFDQALLDRQRAKKKETDARKIFHEEPSSEEDVWGFDELRQSEEFQNMSSFEKLTSQNRLQRELMLKKHQKKRQREQNPGQMDNDSEEQEALPQESMAEQTRKAMKKAQKDRALHGKDPVLPANSQQDPSQNALPPQTKKDRKKAKRTTSPQNQRQKKNPTHKRSKNPVEQPLAAESDSESLPESSEDISSADESSSILSESGDESLKSQKDEDKSPPAKETKDAPEKATENDLTPNDPDNFYKKAMQDQEVKKSDFQEYLRKEKEERKRADDERKEWEAKDLAERKERLEKQWRDTEKMPEELKDIYAEEEKQAAEEDQRMKANLTPKSLRERVEEESKRRKDAHLAEMRRQAEEDRARKQREREEETKRKKAENPNYVPPPPLTVPKGKPKPPPGYKLPDKAREFFGKDSPDYTAKEPIQPESQNFKPSSPPKDPPVPEKSAETPQTDKKSKKKKKKSKKSHQQEPTEPIAAEEKPQELPQKKKKRSQKHHREQLHEREEYQVPAEEFRVDPTSKPKSKRPIKETHRGKLKPVKTLEDEPVLGQSESFDESLEEIEPVEPRLTYTTKKGMSEQLPEETDEKSAQPAKKKSKKRKDTDQRYPHKKSRDEKKRPDPAYQREFEQFQDFDPVFGTQAEIVDAHMPIERNEDAYIREYDYIDDPIFAADEPHRNPTKKHHSKRGGPQADFLDIEEEENETITDDHGRLDQEDLEWFEHQIELMTQQQQKSHSVDEEEIEEYQPPRHSHHQPAKKSKQHSHQQHQHHYQHREDLLKHDEPVARHPDAEELYFYKQAIEEGEAQAESSQDEKSQSAKPSDSTIENSSSTSSSDDDFLSSVSSSNLDEGEGQEESVLSAGEEGQILEWPQKVDQHHPQLSATPYHYDVQQHHPHSHTHPDYEYSEYPHTHHIPPAHLDWPAVVDEKEHHTIAAQSESESEFDHPTHFHHQMMQHQPRRFHHEQMPTTSAASSEPVIHKKVDKRQEAWDAEHFQLHDIYGRKYTPTLSDKDWYLPDAERIENHPIVEFEEEVDSVYHSQQAELLGGSHAAPQSAYHSSSLHPTKEHSSTSHQHRFVPSSSHSFSQKQPHHHHLHAHQQHHHSHSHGHGHTHHIDETEDFVRHLVDNKKSQESKRSRYEPKVPSKAPQTQYNIHSSQSLHSHHRPAPQMTSPHHQPVSYLHKSPQTHHLNPQKSSLEETYGWTTEPKSDDLAHDVITTLGLIGDTPHLFSQHDPHQGVQASKQNTQQEQYYKPTSKSKKRGSQKANGIELDLDWLSNFQGDLKDLFSAPEQDEEDSEDFYDPAEHSYEIAYPYGDYYDHDYELGRQHQNIRPMSLMQESDDSYQSDESNQNDYLKSQKRLVDKYSKKQKQKKSKKPPTKPKKVTEDQEFVQNDDASWMMEYMQKRKASKQKQYLEDKEGQLEAHQPEFDYFEGKDLPKKDRKKMQKDKQRLEKAQRKRQRMEREEQDRLAEGQEEEQTLFHKKMGDRDGNHGKIKEHQKFDKEILQKRLNQERKKHHEDLAKRMEHDAVHKDSHLHQNGSDSDNSSEEEQSESSTSINESSTSSEEVEETVEESDSEQSDEDSSEFQESKEDKIPIKSSKKNRKSVPSKESAPAKKRQTKQPKSSPVTKKKKRATAKTARSAPSKSTKKSKKQKKEQFLPPNPVTSESLAEFGITFDERGVAHVNPDPTILKVPDYLKEKGTPMPWPKKPVPFRKRGRFTPRSNDPSNSDHKDKYSFWQHDHIIESDVDSENTTQSSQQNGISYTISEPRTPAHSVEPFTHSEERLAHIEPYSIESYHVPYDQIDRQPHFNQADWWDNWLPDPESKGYDTQQAHHFQPSSISHFENLRDGPWEIEENLREYESLPEEYHQQIVESGIELQENPDNLWHNGSDFGQKNPIHWGYWPRQTSTSTAQEDLINDVDQNDFEDYLVQ